MSEIDQLKERIDNKGVEGVETSHIRDDYEPAGDMMIWLLCNDGAYTQRKTPANSFEATWKIFKKDCAPY